MKGHRIPVYICGPMSTSGDYIHNIRAGIDAMYDLLELDFAPIVPHLWAFAEIVHPGRSSHAEWLDLDHRGYIPMCKAMYRLPGSSVGADQDELRAKQLGIPVFTSIADLLHWRERL